MKFTYSADVHCGCGAMVAGWPSASSNEAERKALAEATGHGWLQIGDVVWCAKCAAERPNAESVAKVRAGRFLPEKGMSLRYARSKCMVAIPLGHLQGAHEHGFVEGKVYTVARAHVVDPWVLVNFSEKPGVYCNLELFEEVKA